MFSIYRTKTQSDANSDQIYTNHRKAEEIKAGSYTLLKQLSLFLTHLSSSTQRSKLYFNRQQLAIQNWKQ